MSKSSALSMSVLLIFEMQLRNGALFLKANFLSYALYHYFSFNSNIYTTKSHRSDLNIDALNLICLLVLHVSPD